MAADAIWSVTMPIQQVVKLGQDGEEQRLVFGFASIVTDDDGALFVDKQGDRIEVAELEKAAYAYVEESRDASLMHQRRGVATLVASVVLTPEIRKAMNAIPGLDMGISPEGPTGWFVGFRVNDDAVWKRVKSGELSEFSIGGTGRREEVPANAA